ncbi:hypothetical protein CFC21_104724 [Triticum aestivum]|uniref:Uncharacterized protein n=2 Tax=Triticum aestivum TaxID=4565 RepID=A0A9R1MBA1_WHEAT|nr:hypothetical protein CFC21_104724 [Triticum aestivum]
MEKYMNSFPARTIFLCVLLLYSTIHTECQIMQGLANEKINLPTGLCIHRPDKVCPIKPFCFCCLVNGECYLTMDACVSNCAKSASSGIDASQIYGRSPSHVIHR